MRDVDVFRFEARKGESLTFQLESRALGFPLDAVLAITDATGKQLARVDDLPGTRDASLTFSPPADGSYRVVVSDLNRQGSSRHVYRLRAARREPDFEVTADAHSYVLSPAKPIEITLAVARQNGFDEEIGFSVSGLPGFVTADGGCVGSPQGETAKSVKLKLTATAGAFSGPIHITATSHRRKQTTSFGRRAFARGRPADDRFVAIGGGREAIRFWRRASRRLSPLSHTCMESTS